MHPLPSPTLTKATGEKPLQQPKFSAGSSLFYPLYLISVVPKWERNHAAFSLSLSLHNHTNKPTMSLTIPKFTLPFSSSPARKCLTCIAQLTNVPASTVTTTPSVSVGRREGLFLLTSAAAAVAQQLPSLSKSWALVLEAEDDLELLEKVKSDRKKRLERQGVINSSAAETGPLHASFFFSFLYV